MYNTKELMHCHCGTNNRSPCWTFTDPCKPEVRPGAREESASPAWQAAPAMNARDTTKGIYEDLTLDVDTSVVIEKLQPRKVHIFLKYRLFYLIFSLLHDLIKTNGLLFGINKESKPYLCT